MATIQYTTYKFNKPPLIDEKTYTIIKNRLKTTPDYDMFQVESFYEKYKVLIQIYIIGGPISIFCVNSGVNFLEFMDLYADNKSEFDNNPKTTLRKMKWWEDA